MLKKIKSRVGSIFSKSESPAKKARSCFADASCFKDWKKHLNETSGRQGCIDEILNPIYDLFLPFAEEKGLHLQWLLEDSFRDVPCKDQVLLGELIAGLVALSIDNTEEGEVSLLGMLNKQDALINVSDTGMGLDEYFLSCLNLSQKGENCPETLADYKIGILDSIRKLDNTGVKLSVKTEEGVGSVFSISIPVIGIEEREIESSQGEKMLNRWLDENPDNLSLKDVFFKSLNYLREEVSEIKEDVIQQNKEELSRKVHASKGFPGGFGLWEVFKPLDSINDLLRKEPVNWNRINQELGKLDSLMGSIPEVYFHLKEEKGLSVGEQKPSEEKQEKKYRVLVAEDNRINQEIISYSLRMIGCDYSVVTDGMQVLQILEEERFDLLLLDIQMPGMGGIETMVKIRSRTEWEALPVIAVTGASRPDERRQIEDVGCNDFLAKPFKIVELTEKVRQYLPDKNDQH